MAESRAKLRKMPWSFGFKQTPETGRYNKEGKTMGKRSHVIALFVFLVIRKQKNIIDIRHSAFSFTRKTNPPLGLSFLVGTPPMPKKAKPTKSSRSNKQS